MIFVFKLTLMGTNIYICRRSMANIYIAVEGHRPERYRNSKEGEIPFLIGRYHF